VKRILASLACAAVLGGLAFTQSTETKPVFVMADIHVSPDTQGGGIRMGFFGTRPWVGGGRYEIRRASLLNLINEAYGVDPEKILDGPNWMEWDAYDINAKLPAESTPETQKVMLQNLLADRFKLVTHNDTRDLQAYVLTAGKSPKIKQSEGPGDTGCRGTPSGPGITAMPGGGFMINSTAGPIINSVVCHNMTMEAFATYLRPQVSQNGSVNPVTDQTELKGAWDFDFKTTLNFRGPMGASPDNSTITIFDAVDKQLGLKLTATKVPLRVVVVDSAQKPTPNAAGVTEAMAVEHPKEFDVADVKPNEPGGRGGRVQVTKGGGVNFQNMQLRFLILQAYGLQNNMLITTPDVDAALQAPYTIMAKPPAPAANAGSRDEPSTAGPQGPMGPQASPDDNEAAWLMMRALLEDRFKLKMHKEERPLTAWKLVAVKPKMKKADPSERTKQGEGPLADGKDPRTVTPSRSRLSMFQNVTMDQFADKLQGISAYLNTPVVNATNLEGSYDFTISYSPVGMAGAGLNNGPLPTNGGGRGGPVGQEAIGPPGSSDAAEPNGAITLFEAIEQQLGLKLVEDKRPVTVYVIDHVEAKPTDN
jgi:uncharacterized protein (TIGR03435 family)